MFSIAPIDPVSNNEAGGLAIIQVSSPTVVNIFHNAEMQVFFFFFFFTAMPLG